MIYPQCYRYKNNADPGSRKSEGRERAAAESRKPSSPRGPSDGGYSGGVDRRWDAGGCAEAYNLAVEELDLGIRRTRADI